MEYIHTAFPRRNNIRPRFRSLKTKPKKQAKKSNKFNISVFNRSTMSSTGPVEFRETYQRQSVDEHERNSQPTPLKDMGIQTLNDDIEVICARKYKIKQFDRLLSRHNPEILRSQGPSRLASQPVSPDPDRISGSLPPYRPCQTPLNVSRMKINNLPKLPDFIKTTSPGPTKFRKKVFKMGTDVGNQSYYIK